MAFCPQNPLLAYAFCSLHYFVFCLSCYSIKSTSCEFVAKDEVICSFLDKNREPSAINDLLEEHASLKVQGALCRISK